MLLRVEGRGAMLRSPRGRKIGTGMRPGRATARHGDPRSRVAIAGSDKLLDVGEEVERRAAEAIQLLDQHGVDLPPTRGGHALLG